MDEIIKRPELAEDARREAEISQDRPDRWSRLVERARTAERLLTEERAKSEGLRKAVGEFIGAVDTGLEDHELDAFISKARALSASTSPTLQQDAVREIVAERERQISVEGWTPEHDDEHGNCELVRAAAVYAINASLDEFPADDAPTLHAIMRDAMGHLWPWAASWWKPKNPRRDLVKAGALILAEIERLDRARLSHPIPERGEGS